MFKKVTTEEISQYLIPDAERFDLSDDKIVIHPPIKGTTLTFSCPRLLPLGQADGRPFIPGYSLVEQLDKNTRSVEN